MTKKASKKKTTKKKVQKKKVSEVKQETQNVVINCDFKIIPIVDNWFSHDPFKVVAIEFGPELGRGHRQIKGFFLYSKDLGLDFYGGQFVDDIINCFYPYCSIEFATNDLKKDPNFYDRDEKVWKEIAKTLRKNIRLVKKLQKET